MPIADVPADHLVRLIAAYEEGLSGLEAAQRAALGRLRHAPAMIRLVRLLQAWPHGSDALH